MNKVFKNIVRFLPVVFVGISFLLTCSTRKSIQDYIGVPQTKISNPVKACHTVSTNDQFADQSVVQKKVKRNAPLVLKQDGTFQITAQDVNQPELPTSDSHYTHNSPPLYILFKRLKLPAYS